MSEKSIYIELRRTWGGLRPFFPERADRKLKKGLEAIDNVQSVQVFTSGGRDIVGKAVRITSNGDYIDTSQVGSVIEQACYRPGNELYEDNDATRLVYDSGRKLRELKK